MRTTYFLLLAVTVPAALLSQQAARRPYTILYTGSTLGYARTPDIQIVPTPPGAPVASSQAAIDYLRLFKEAARDSKGAVLRLGMGDNFAPDLFARTFQTAPGPFYPASQPDSTCYPPILRTPKDRYFFDTARNWNPVSLLQSKLPADKDPNKRYEEKAAQGRTSIDFDNVAQFLIDAGYHAIVPGKYDFYFGTERLRDLARLLARQKVYMLAANLVISTTRAPQPSNAFPRTPQRLDPPQAFPNNFGAVSLDLAPMVLPYKRQFLVKNARTMKLKPPPGALAPSTAPAALPSLVAPSELRSLTTEQVTYDWTVEAPRICVEPGVPVIAGGTLITSGNPADAMKGSCYPLVAADVACASPIPVLMSTCKSLYPSGYGFPSHPSPDAVYLFPDGAPRLVAGRNHAFCANILDTSKTPPTSKPSCSPFPVEMPFLDLGDQTGLVNWPAPYIMVDGVAVFGVVDADLLSNVGLLNAGWRNEKSSLDTMTKVAPPDYALKQALEQCAADPACQPAPKVLMAQMSYARAAQLATRMSIRSGDPSPASFEPAFDVVISQADSLHSTGKRDFTESPTNAQATLHPQSPSQFVLTPPEPFSMDANYRVAKPTFTPQVSRAMIGKSGAMCSLQNTVHTADAFSDDPPNCNVANPVSLLDASNATLSALKVAPPKPGTVLDPSDRLADLALVTMQRALDTDIAFLQKRDIFDGDGLSLQSIPAGEVYNQINRIFWKGDFVIPLHVTGATLKKLMKQSKKFEEMDHDLLSTEIELGRAVRSVGIWPDDKDSDSYYVNGIKLDDTKMYTVAATEFLAVGDTGFADLATPDVPPPTRIEDFNRLAPLADMICNRIRNTAGFTAVTCPADQLDKTYFDSSMLRPFDTTPGFTAAAHYTTIPRRFLPIPVPAKNANGIVEQRRHLSINLEALDVSWGGTYVSHVNQAAGKFTGITAPGVTTSGSTNVAADHKLRVIYDMGRPTFYALSDSNFARTTTTTASYATIASNVWGMEGGGTIRARHDRPTWLSFQYSVRFEGQLTDPSPTSVKFTTPALMTGDPNTFVTFQPVAPAGPVTNLLVYPPRSSSLFGRTGVRAEFGDLYLEAGFEEIDARHVATTYTFAPYGVANPVACVPAPGPQLSCTGGTLPAKDPNGNPLSVGIAKDIDLTYSILPSKDATTDYLTRGLYLNFNFKFPLWSKKDAAGGEQSWYFILTNKGDLYGNSPRNDTSTQTRYLDKFTTAFSLPLYGKLTLTPKVEFLFYENKVAHQKFRSATPALALSYSFNYRKGMNFWRSLGYGAISTPQPPSK